MDITYYNIIALFCVFGVIWGIHWMNSPKTAIKGNIVGAISLFIAVIVTLISNEILDSGVLWIGIVLGGLIGYYIAVKVTMVKMPQMVALLNGLGGGASGLVSILILVNEQGGPDLFSKSAAIIALIVGSITFSGSIIAAGKLDQKISQRPVVLKGHSFLIAAVLLVTVIVSIFTIFTKDINILLPTVFVLLGSLLFGTFFTIRVGGADMPITISLLNSLSGVAGAIAGFAIYDILLIAVGGVVGAAGLILTQVMCRSMNRSLLHVLAGKTSVEGKGKKDSQKAVQQEIDSDIKEKEILLNESDEDIDSKIKKIIQEARNIIVVPGYGMALAQAQYQVKNMYDIFIKNNKDVKFAIHPVAGRMPGHMNVLLAEVDIPYDKLYDLDSINDEFGNTDLVIVVGANDVINPAAINAEDTPIYGMPILHVDKAKNIIICNWDTKPGYSGVPNEIYKLDKVVLKLGDAKDTVSDIIQKLS
jgi:NAD(P) transhydrogenase subunit beta